MVMMFYELQKIKIILQKKKINNYVIFKNNFLSLFSANKYIEIINELKIEKE